jgi:O-antigen ligase
VSQEIAKTTNTSVENDKRLSWPFILGLFACCVLAGLASAYLGWREPIIPALFLFLLLAGIFSGLFFGGTGSIIMTAAVMAILLMVRFDELFMIPVASLWLKTHHWGMIVLALALALAALPYQGQSSRLPEARAFRSLLFPAWILLALTGGMGLLVHAFWEGHIPLRETGAEAAVLFVILAPIAFAAYTPLSGLSRRHTVFCLRTLIALGGMGGFIMAVFGLLPDRIIGALGWVGATGGTLDLVRGRLPLGHPNHVATMMLLLYPAATILGLAGRHFLWRIFYLACAGLMFCGVLFSLSRAALLCLGLIFAVVMVYLFLAYGRHHFLGIVLAGFFGVFLLGTTAYLFSTHDFSRFWSRGYYEEASVERRAESMHTALLVWRDHLFLGAGPGAVYPRLEMRPDFASVAEDQISPIIYYRGSPTAETPHNFYLTVLAELGIFGALFFFGILFSIARAMWRVWRLPGIDPYERNTLTGLGLGLLAFMMMAMFEAVLMTGARISMVFWIFAGLSLRYAFIVAGDTRAQGPEENGADESHP